MRQFAEIVAIEAGIVESVYSLVGLRYPKHEVIVVNDGSTDGTMARLEKASKSTLVG